MNRQDEEQKHSKHKALNEKLKKKRTREKELKKQKRIRKAEYDPVAEKEKFFNREKKAQREGSGRADERDKLVLSIRKFLQIYEEDLADFLEIFKDLDEGNRVETAEIENKQILKYLLKIFKYLKLSGSPSGAFRKDLHHTIPSL